MISQSSGDYRSNPYMKPSQEGGSGQGGPEKISQRSDFAKLNQLRGEWQRAADHAQLQTSKPLSDIGASQLAQKMQNLKPTAIQAAASEKVAHDAKSPLHHKSLVSNRGTHIRVTASRESERDPHEQSKQWLRSDNKKRAVNAKSHLFLLLKNFQYSKNQSQALTERHIASINENQSLRLIPSELFSTNKLRGA